MRGTKERMGHWLDRLPDAVTIVEVGPRDGLQSANVNLPTAQKVELIERLAAAGLRYIEATSFVSPRAVPHLADAEAVMAGVRRTPGVRYLALIPNRRGLERALAARVDEVTLPVSASDSHNRANLRRPTAQVLARVPDLVAMAHEAGVRVRGGIATAFGCPFEGEVPVERVVWVATRLVESGVDVLSLADTTGMADPVQVARVVDAVRAVLPEGVPLGVHLHNTRGAGLANALAALVAEVTILDASVGGIGGCPFAPGATGNICTEDLVHMLEQMGVATGVNLEALVETARWLEEALGYRLPGQVMKAGPVAR